METIQDSLLQTQIFGNSLLMWGGAFVTGAVLFLGLKIVQRSLNQRIGSLSQKTATVADDLLAAALDSTQMFFMLVVAVWAGSRWLVLGAKSSYISFALLLAVVLQVAIWANRMVSAYIAFYTDTRREVNPAAVSVVQGLSFIVRLVIWSLAFLLLVDNLGYDVTALVAGLGISGIAVALALQNILGDLFASLSIVLDKPFVIGDFIIVGDLMGVVERIGLKTTRVRSLSGEQLIFANSDLLGSRVRNFKRMQERRVAFGLGVLYQTTPEQLEAIPPLIKKSIESLEHTRFDRAHFKGFGASSYDFEIVYYVLTADYALYMDIQQSINLAIVRGFADMGVEFAYPTQTLFVHNETGADPEVPSPAFS